MVLGKIVAPSSQAILSAGRAVVLSEFDHGCLERRHLFDCAAVEPTSTLGAYLTCCLD